VTTNAATNVAASTATLNGSANPNGDATTGWFRYAPSTPGACNDSFGIRAPFSGGTSLGSGTSAVSYSQAISGLTASKTYYFCAIAENTGGKAFGSVLSFTTSEISSTSGYLVSSTFDTGIFDGVQINSLLWQGSFGTGGTNSVKFQVASAGCQDGSSDPPSCSTNPGWGGSKVSGDGAFIGSDGTSSTYYEPTGPGIGYAIPINQHNNKRYFRYKVFLDRDMSSTSPTVEDIIVNWSP
jgi:hypothetical protein